MAKLPAGYHERERIETELPSLSQRQRSAFAAACAARVLPVLKDYLTRDLLCECAIETTWRFACAESYDKAAAEKLREDLDGVIEELQDDGETGATLHAAKAAIFALESTLWPESEPAFLASCEAMDAADGDMDDGDTHVQEEANWHAMALDVTLKTSKPARDMFASLNREPDWLRAFLMRDA
jgi:hypothetical protein